MPLYKWYSLCLIWDVSYASRVKRHLTKHTCISSVARSDKNVCKITARRENGSTYNDTYHRVTAPLIPKVKGPSPWSSSAGGGGGGEGGIAKTTNETPIFFSITSNAKMKKEIQIHFSKWCENEKEKRSSNPFFKVRRKTKTVSEIWIPLSYAIEKRLALRYMDWGTSQKTSCVERIVPGNSSTVVSQQLLLIAHDC